MPGRLMDIVCDKYYMLWEHEDFIKWLQVWLHLTPILSLPAIQSVEASITVLIYTSDYCDC